MAITFGPNQNSPKSKLPILSTAGHNHSHAPGTTTTIVPGAQTTVDGTENSSETSGIGSSSSHSPELAEQKTSRPKLKHDESSHCLPSEYSCECNFLILLFVLAPLIALIANIYATLIVATANRPGSPPCVTDTNKSTNGVCLSISLYYLR